MCSLPFPSFLPLETVPPPPNPAYSIRLKSGRVRRTGLAFGTQPWVLKRTLGLGENIQLPASPVARIPFGFRFVIQELMTLNRQNRLEEGSDPTVRASHTLGMVGTLAG